MVSKLVHLLKSLARKKTRTDEASDELHAIEGRREAAPRVPMQQPASLMWIDDEGEPGHDVVEISNSSPDGVGIIASRALPVGLMVIVDGGEGFNAKAVGRYCRKDTEAYRVGLKLIHHDHRRFERCPLCGEGVLHWTDSSGKSISSAVRLRDGTPEGVQVEVPRPVPASSLVRLLWDEWACLGFTGYCKSAAERNKYLVGIHFAQQVYHIDSLEYKG